MFVRPHAYSFIASRYPEPTSFGEYIKKARLEKGLRQKDVAQVIGVFEMTIVRWEKHTTIPPRHRSNKMNKLGGVLSLDFEDMSHRFPWSGKLPKKVSF